MGGTGLVLQPGVEAAGTDGNAAEIELAGHPYQAVRRSRLRRWGFLLVAADASAAAVAMATSLVTRFGVSGVNANTNTALAIALVPGWLAVMAIAGAYDLRCIPSGAELYRRVINAAVWLLAAVAVATFALKFDPSRQFVLVSIPATALCTVIARYAVRKTLHRSFARGAAAHKVLAVGSTGAVSDLLTHINRAQYAGFKIVALLTPDTNEPPSLPVGVHWSCGDLQSAAEQATLRQCDTIALAGGNQSARELRRLSWLLDDSDIDLVVAPALTDLAGPRIRIRPIEGLPLLHIDKPQFTGARRVVKEAIDRVLGTLFLLLALPVMLVVAIAIRLTSRGPVLYKQARVGLSGREFRLLKFRSMHHDADQAQYGVEDMNEHNGVLFKIRRDPRITRPGRFLRRFSLDELPQLWNVVRGDMSLVGPRPPLPSEVERYRSDVHRRLLVKPGLTGLWQVSGRSDLSWEETVRLDLYYVDNWSVGLDLVLLLKTFVSVVRGRGAY
jgi:exopolysaccharide biosynthesis polyprenyl glycosylphosphotransferase